MTRKKPNISERPVAMRGFVGPDKLENAVGIDTLPGERVWGKLSIYDEEDSLDGPVIRVVSLRTGDAHGGDYAAQNYEDEKSPNKNDYDTRHIILMDSASEPQDE